MVNSVKPAGFQTGNKVKKPKETLALASTCFGYVLDMRAASSSLRSGKANKLPGRYTNIPACMVVLILVRRTEDNESCSPRAGRCCSTYRWPVNTNLRISKI